MSSRPGSNCRNMTLATEVYSGQGQLSLRAHGGRGQAGQGGVNGCGGLNGTNAKAYGRILPPPSVSIDGPPPSRGDAQAGGDGGAGGSGGNGGVIAMTLPASINASLIATGASGGDHGADGTPGSGGAIGAVGTLTVSTHPLHGGESVVTIQLPGVPGASGKTVDRTSPGTAGRGQDGSVTRTNPTQPPSLPGQGPGYQQLRLLQAFDSSARALASAALVTWQEQA